MEKKSLHIARLMGRYLRNELSDPEIKEFQDWLDCDIQNQKLLDRFTKQECYKNDLLHLGGLDVEQAWQKNISRTKGGPHPVKFNYQIVAAAILILLVGGWVAYKTLFSSVSTNGDTDSTLIVQRDFAPATIGANLLLSDGSRIDLEADQLSIRNNTIYLKGDNETVLTDVNPDQKHEAVYNTLEVPQAKYFKMHLSDGTLVWINSMSKLRFPVNFSGTERKVFLEGEAYFEVAHNPEKPFVVSTEGTDIKVLGTHFNVDSYTSVVRTTLVEGSVLVDNGRDQVRLRPGEYAGSTHESIRRGRADIEYSLAWKNEEFLFKDDNIVTIATQLSRWYGVDVKFRGNIPHQAKYTGSISRQAKLSETIKMLEFVSDLAMEVINNELIISKKEDYE